MSRSKLRGGFGGSFAMSPLDLCLEVGCLVFETTAAVVLVDGVLVTLVAADLEVGLEELDVRVMVKLCGPNAMASVCVLKGRLLCVLVGDLEVVRPG